MRTGSMNERLTLTPPAAARGTHGQTVPNTAAAVEVWAAVESIKATDRVAGNAVLVTAELKARVRYRDGITPQFTAAWRGVTYAIIGVDFDARRTESYLYLKRRG